MRSLLINDLHLASRGPSTRVDDWHATVNRKLDFVEATADAENVDCICIAGDVFHLTTLAYGSMTEVVKRFRRLAQRWPIPVIAGNHDLPYHRIDRIDQTPFGVMLAAGILTPVWDGPTYLNYRTAGWVGGINYPVTEEAIRNYRCPNEPGIMMLHCYASMDGGDVFGEPCFSYMKLAQWLPNVRVWHFGHNHADNGVATLGNMVFVQVGALLRGTLAEDQINRQPKLVVVDTDEGVGYKTIDVPVEPAEKVFDLTKRAQVVTADEAIDAFIEHLGTISDERRTITVDLSFLPREVEKRVRQYLSLASGSREVLQSSAS